MARHSIEIPITKSSNGTHVYVGNVFTGINEIRISRVSDSLYLGNGSPIGLGWNGDLIPRDKKIISIDLHIYADGSLNPVSIPFKYMDFAEGGNMPYPSSPDKAFGRINSGWNTLPLPVEVGVNSCVIGASFDPELGFDYTTFNSSRASSRKPYLVVTYDDIPPDNPTSLYPNGITVNPRDIIRFAWEHNSKENLQQKGFSLQYSTNNGSSWTTVNQATPNQFYDMPANTLPNTGSVLWRVRTTDGNDETSGYTTGSFTLGIVPQKPPVPISPISQFIDENKPVRFEWAFVGGSPGEIQSKFDLQYSTNGGNSWTTRTVSTKDNFYELPAGTLNGGNITWRVRTYNNWNEVSPYSENKSFTVIGSPPIPLISSVTNAGRPNITWQSNDQHIYELEVLQGNKVIFETGSVPSTTDRSIRLPIYLEDGTYKARLRIANEYNLYSPWAEKTFVISTTKPNKPTMDIYSGGYGVTIKISSNNLRTLVYRDKEYIGELVNNNFTDYTGENDREYKYFIRVIDGNDNFADSEIKLAKCTFKGNTLALASNPGDFSKLQYGFGVIPKKTNSVGNDGSLVYYDGREYPVAEYSEFKSKVKTVSFTLRTKSELDKLEDLINARETLLYRDVDGENIYGAVFNLDYEKNILGYYEVGFTITKTDYKGVAHD